MKLINKVKFGIELVKAHVQEGYRIPLSVYFFVTYRCPLRCRYCNIINSSSGSKRELSTNEILGLIDDMADAGTQKIHFTGGEPMMRDDIGEIIYRAKKKNMFVGLSSNGYYIPEKIEVLRDIDIVFLSLDGEEKIHDYARGEGSFKKVMIAMESLKSRNIDFWTTTVINKTNKNSMEYILKMAKEKAFIVNFQILHSRNNDYKSCFCSENDASNFLMNPEEIKTIISYIIKKKNQKERIGTSLAYLNQLLNWDDYRIMYKINSKVKCWAGRLYCYLETNGKLYPCGTLLEQVRGQDTMKLGFKEAFNRLKNIPCSTCLSACHVEQNLIFSLNLNTIKNWLRIIK